MDIEKNHQVKQSLKLQGDIDLFIVGLDRYWSSVIPSELADSARRYCTDRDIHPLTLLYMEGVEAPIAIKKSKIDNQHYSRFCVHRFNLAWVTAISVIDPKQSYLNKK